MLEQPKRLIFALNVMAIRDRRHANKSKRTTSLSGFDVAPPIGVASGSHDLMFFIFPRTIPLWNILPSSVVSPKIAEEFKALI